MNRIVEAYVGEYASGKSENAVNRSLDLVARGRKVTLVDLDLVEPVYTLRPLKRPLEDEGVDVIAWETKDTVGLGEAGIILHPAMRWPLKREGDIILDVGYGAKGSSILGLLEGMEEEKSLAVLLVVNTFRPITGSVVDILSYIRELGRVDGVISNSNRAEKTEIDDIFSGFEMVREVSVASGLPLVALSVDERFAPYFPKADYRGVPVRLIRRWMPRGFW